MPTKLLELSLLSAEGKIVQLRIAGIHVKLRAPRGRNPRLETVGGVSHMGEFPH